MVPFATGGHLAHITNARESDKFVGKGGFTPYHHYWNMVDLQRYLNKRHADDPKYTQNFVDVRLRPWIKQAMRFAFESGRYEWEMVEQYGPGRSMIFAFDFVLDADFNAYLLEGNGNPSMNENAQHSAGGNEDNLLASMVEAITRVQTEDWPRERPPERVGGWELVYNEAQEACERPYDPCALFELSLIHI